MASFPWWLQAIWQPFKWTPQNTHAHSGTDLGMPCGSQLTAPVNATVISDGMENWGGQVNLLVPAGEMPSGYDQSSPYILSYLHMQRIDVQPGQTVPAGTQLGLSGQPPPGYGSGCHLHFEVTHGDTPPYMGYSPWYPTATSYPQDAAPLLSVLGGSVGKTGGYAVTASSATSQQSSSSCGDGSIYISLGPFSFCLPLLTYRLFTQLKRVLKMATAGILLMIATLLVVVPATVGPALEVAGVASGKPSLAKIGAGFRQTRKQNRQARRYGMPKPVNPSPVSGTLAEGVQRSRETRRLDEQEASHAAAYRAAVTPQPQPQAAQPPTGVTANPATGKRTMRAEIIPPGTGGPWAAKLVPSVGPNVPSKPPRAKKTLEDLYKLRAMRGGKLVQDKKVRAEIVRAERQRQQELAQAKARRALREKAPATRKKRDTISPEKQQEMMERIKEALDRGEASVRDAFGKDRLGNSNG